MDNQDIQQLKGLLDEVTKRQKQLQEQYKSRIINRLQEIDKLRKDLNKEEIELRKSLKQISKSPEKDEQLKENKPPVRHSIPKIKEKPKQQKPRIIADEWISKEKRMEEIKKKKEMDKLKQILEQREKWKVYKQNQRERDRKSGIIREADLTPRQLRLLRKRKRSQPLDVEFSSEDETDTENNNQRFVNLADEPTPSTSHEPTPSKQNLSGEPTPSTESQPNEPTLSNKSNEPTPYKPGPSNEPTQSKRSQSNEPTPSTSTAPSTPKKKRVAESPEVVITRDEEVEKRAEEWISYSPEPESPPKPPKRPDEADSLMQESPQKPPNIHDEAGSSTKFPGGSDAAEMSAASNKQGGSLIQGGTKNNQTSHNLQAPILTSPNQKNPIRQNLAEPNLTEVVDAEEYVDKVRVTWTRKDDRTDFTVTKEVEPDIPDNVKQPGEQPEQPEEQPGESSKQPSQGAGENKGQSAETVPEPDVTKDQGAESQSTVLPLW